MFDVAQFKEQIIVPAISKIHLHSADAVELLVFTCAVESNGGTYLKQVKGPALGIYQMEPRTYTDLWQNYIRRHGDILLAISANFDAPRIPSEDRMIYDLQYATAMARIFYRRIAEPLPSRHDVDAMWEYYKKYYNTHLGKAVKENCLEKYQTFISGKKQKKNS